MSLTIATWNVNSLRVRLPQLREWLATESRRRHRAAGDQAPGHRLPERRDSSARVPRRLFAGQRTYNGVAMLSRQPLVDVVAGIPGFDDEQRRVLAATTAGLRVVDVYVPNGQAVGSDKYAYKLRWLASLRDRGYVRRGAQHRASSCSATSTSRPRIATCTTRRPGKARPRQPAERDGLRRSRARPRRPVPAFEQPEKSYSWWDYRTGAFRRNARPAHRPDPRDRRRSRRSCTACTIDREPRRAEGPPITRP
jgi:exodeoxyribonuclease-3